MVKGKIIVAGIGPGNADDITPAVLKAVSESDIVIGYKYYFRFIEHALKKDAVCIDSGMRQERQRAEEAFNMAREGHTVCVISSGDAGIYGMAPLVHEMSVKNGDEQIEIETLPGISAFQKAASLLGAPTGHDLCIISMSDLMTPWAMIEKRIRAAATGDFVTAVYNPKSHGRYWQIYRLKEIFMQERKAETPVGYVRNAGREGQTVVITTLEQFAPEDIDMFTVVIIGNSQTYMASTADGSRDVMITPRGYYREDLSDESANIGQNIMIKSFRTIEGELRNKDIPLDKKWAMLHAIHTTADFDMERLLWMDDGAVASLYEKVNSGELKTIVTDVTMAASGIRKGALQRLGIEVKCYINDPRGAEMAKELNITRAQAGMRLAAQEHPDALYVFGNAPTALLELCDLIRKGKASPAGIIGAPVGFVHVEESKHAAKPFRSIPKILIEGRKGGSNLAATLVNSILTYDDAEQLRPGRDV